MTAHSATCDQNHYPDDACDNVTQDEQDAIEPATLTCGAWQVEDGRCGEPAVATSLEDERGRCPSCLSYEVNEWGRAPKMAVLA